MFQIRTILSLHVRQYSNVNNSHLKQILFDKILVEREKIKKFRAEHGNKTVGEIKVNMIYGGMRGMNGLICETSYLDPNEGIRFRGFSIPQLLKKLPRAEGGEHPLPEGMFWLILTGDLPTENQVSWLSKEWAFRSNLPNHVSVMLKNLPVSLHPMAQLSCAVTALHHYSKFTRAYNKGVQKSAYWEYFYEDAMDLIGKITVIAAIIFNNTYRSRLQTSEVDDIRDWSWNFTDLIGANPDIIADMMRLYFMLHCDHEGGNVCTHATHLVGSALSDVYLSYAAGINGLAGLLRGLANQQSVKWLLQLRDEVGSHVDDPKLIFLLQDRLNAGEVIPGYGHAILRHTDPRFICLKKFADKHMVHNPLYILSSKVVRVLPPLLNKMGKVSCPWPNVDSISGVVLQHYGINQLEFYTVLFAIARCLGAMANLIWARALELPIERPKSYTTIELMKMVQKNN